MPLQNRVDPFGDLHANTARGTLFGNRGGKFHNDDRTLGERRWVSRQWICCVLDFKGRQRDVWGRYYTELFFLDEVTALAAGHRPCFECRRKNAQEFAARFPRTSPSTARLSAPAMDEILHAERLEGKLKRFHRRKIETLPDGVTIAFDGAAFVLRGKRLLRWTPSGYTAAKPRPRAGEVDLLTPPSTAAVLAAGYRPLWHPSAEP